MLNDVVIANKTYAKLTDLNEGMLDDIAIKVIKQDIPDFLLPIKTLSIDGQIELRYEISEGMRLSYLPENMTKKEFLVLLESMLRPFKICNDWFLDYHNLYLNKNYIMVGKSYTTVKYVYVPSAQYAQDDEDILEFFRNIILDTNITDAPEFAMKLFRQIKDKNASLVSVLNYIIQENVNNNDAMTNENAQQAVGEGGLGGIINKVADWAGGVGQAAQQVVQQQVNNQVHQQKTSPQKQIQQNPFEQKNMQMDIGKEEELVKQSSGEAFGKVNTTDALVNNLFGNIEEPKKGKGKEPKQPKPSKQSKEKETKEKEAKDGLFDGLFGGIFGGGNKKANDNEPVQNVIQNHNSMNQYGGQQYGKNIQPAQPINPIAQTPNIMNGDNTVIGGSVGTSNGSKLCLELLEGKGYQFPRTIELDLSKGSATIGRYDKNGNPQADFNFDVSLSFISRRHLRIERNGMGYTVIDLGSGNGTYVNNQALVPNMPYDANIGDKIILSRDHRITYEIR